MSTTTPLILLVLTTVAKIGFGVFFTTGSTYHHPGQYYEAIEFCLDIYQEDYYFELFFCYIGFVQGLLIAGAILFFISILLEAFGPNKILIGGSIVPTMFNGIGSLFLIVSSMYPILLMREGLFTFYYDHPDFEAGFWIASGLITGLGQAYLAYALRLEGLFVVVTYLIASLGSVLFMVGGIMNLQDVTVPNEDTISGLMISGSVFYIIHGILYPIATYKKIKDLITNQENPAVTVTNASIGDEEKC